MGLFSSIIGGVGSLLTGSSSSKAAKNAAAAQTAALNRAIDLQQQQFDTTRSDNLPFLQAGQNALGGANGLLSLLGQNGDDAAASAIGGLKSSPLFTSRYDTGLDAILQAASATGGLRGGNTENSLAQFGSGLLGDVYGSQITNLMNLVGIGSGTGATLSSAGQNSTNATSSLLTQQGNAQASGILGSAAANNQGLSGLLKSVTGGGQSTGMDSLLMSILGL